MAITIARRAILAAIGGALAACPVAVRAQRHKSPRIGALVLTNRDAQLLGTSLRDGLREFGYVEGQNVDFEIRSATGRSNLLPELAAELVHLEVDVIVAVYTPCALAAKQAARETPIIAVAVGDPIGTGLVAGLARPGGNVTGLSSMAAETAGKSVELLRDMLSSVRRVAVLANPTDPFTKPFLEQVQLAGRTAGIEIQPVAMARGPDEVEAAFAAIASERADAVVVQGIFFSKNVADAAIKHRLPTASALRSYVDVGGLMSYGANLPDLFRRSALFVHKVLQGTKPAELPVEQPTKFELAINLTTARAIGLTIPEEFKLRADTVIE
jgi:putative ABC transport system substrate-binding protein